MRGKWSVAAEARGLVTGPCLCSLSFDNGNNLTQVEKRLCDLTAYLLGQIVSIFQFTFFFAARGGVLFYFFVPRIKIILKVKVILESKDILFR